MTSEIAIINSQAVALAADSAVTISSGKIYNSANKLFALSKKYPVGIMVYGNAELVLNYPWETIIKVYRSELNGEPFNRLKDYALNFIKFLEKNSLKISQKEQEQFVKTVIFSLFDTLKKDIEKEWEEVLDNQGEATEANISEGVTKTIEKHLKLRLKHAPLDFQNYFKRGV